MRDILTSLEAASQQVKVTFKLKLRGEAEAMRKPIYKGGDGGGRGREATEGGRYLPQVPRLDSKLSYQDYSVKHIVFKKQIDILEGYRKKLESPCKTKTEEGGQGLPGSLLWGAAAGLSGELPRHTVTTTTTASPATIPPGRLGQVGLCSPRPESLD